MTPSKIKLISDRKMIEDLRAANWKDEAIRAKMGIGRTTFYDRLKVVGMEDRHRKDREC